MEIALRLAAACALIAANAAFVAAEFALVAVDRTRVDERAGAGDRRARRVRSLLSRLSFHLSGAQVGITVTSLLLGFLAEPAIAAAITPAMDIIFGDGATPRGVSVVTALAIATVVQMVIGELIPKTVATTKPYGTAVTLSIPIATYGVIAKPCVAFLNAIANSIVRRLGVEPCEEMDPTPEDRGEFRHLFQSSGSEGELDDGEVRMLTKTIGLADKRADSIMVPRVEVIAVHQNATAGDLAEVSVHTGHSRFPVIGQHLDHVVGVVHVKTVHSLPIHQRASTLVSDLMSPILAVPESHDLIDLLRDLRGNRHHGTSAGQLAVIIDEHGGTAGIVTLEDVLEEIVGEIDDEHDTVEHDTFGNERTSTESKGSVTISASLHADEVFEMTGFLMPSGHYGTLAGLMLDRLGHIPVPGETVTVDGQTLEVVAMNGLRIATVKLIHNQ